MSANRGRIFSGASVACGYHELPERVLPRLCRLGIKSFEIFFNTHSELEPEYVGELKGILDDYGAECISVHPFTCGSDTYMLYSGYKRREQDYIEYHKRYFEAMNLLGARYFVLHGNKSESAPDSVVFEGYLRLDDCARSFGVRVLQENVVRCTTGRLEQLVRMKKALGDRVGFVLDTKQAVRSGYDPTQFVYALGDSIKHIHFSDHGPAGDCLLPGAGELDTVGFIEALNSVGFSGGVILELYRRNFGRYEELSAGVRDIQSAIDTVLG